MGLDGAVWLPVTVDCQARLRVVYDTERVRCQAALHRRDQVDLLIGQTQAVIFFQRKPLALCSLRVQIFASPASLHPSLVP